MTDPILAVVGLKREAALIAGPRVITVIGGGDRAGLARKLDAALRRQPFVGVVSVGLGGALSPRLTAGDWVVAERVVGRAESWECDSAWVAALQRAFLGAALPLTLPASPGPSLSSRGRGVGAASDPLPAGEREGPAAGRWEGEGNRRCRVFTGAVAGSDVMVVTSQTKAALHAATGALAVDMESHVAATFAAAHALPFVALRVISDGADRALPKAAQAGMRQDGGMDVLAVLKALAKDPRQLQALVRTGREAEVAFQALKLLNRHDLLGRLGVGDPDLGQLLFDVV